MARARSIVVRDWMSRRIISIRPDSRLGEAATVMRRRKIRHLPVVERGGRLVGIVTARDLRQALFAPSVQAGLSNLRGVLDTVAVRDIMRRRVDSVSPDTSIQDAARLMHERGIGALPVMARRRLVGMLTDSDVLAGLQRALGGAAISR